MLLNPYFHGTTTLTGAPSCGGSDSPYMPTHSSASGCMASSKRSPSTYTGVEILHYIADAGEGCVVEEVPPVPELTHGQGAELEGVSRGMGDFLPPVVLGVVGEAVRTQLGGVDVASRQRVERLDRMVADSDVEEILLDELADPGDVRIVILLIQHRTAVTGETTRATRAASGRSEEQLCASNLPRG